MDTHPKNAQYILNMISSQGMNCPVAEVENFVEIKKWLKDLAEGRLVVTEASPPPGANGE